MAQDYGNFVPVNWEDSNSEEEEGDDWEDEEALSLSDLPLNLIDEEDHEPAEERADHSADPQEDDFDFGFDFGTSFQSGFESKMCAADDVFFCGKMLPLRRLSSVDSDHAARLPPRILSRSESVDSGSFSSATSGTTSRSSSTGSANSSNCSCAVPIARTRNPFHAHPSPQPQVRIPTGRARSSDGSSRCRKSILWETFKLGLVRTPEIQFKDLKLRNNNANGRNSSSGNHSSNPRNPNHETNGGRRRSPDYRLWSMCKCSIGAVEIPSKKTTNSVGAKISAKSVVAEEEEEEEEEGKKRGRQSRTRQRTRHRTSEWVEEVSHAVGSYHSLSF